MLWHRLVDVRTHILLLVVAAIFLLNAATHFSSTICRGFNGSQGTAQYEASIDGTMRANACFEDYVEAWLIESQSWEPVGASCLRLTLSLSKTAIFGLLTSTMKRDWIADRCEPAFVAETSFSAGWISSSRTSASTAMITWRLNKDPGRLSDIDSDVKPGKNTLWNVNAQKHTTTHHIKQTARPTLPYPSFFFPCVLFVASIQTSQ